MVLLAFDEYDMDMHIVQMTTGISVWSMIMLLLIIIMLNGLPQM